MRINAEGEFSYAATDVADATTCAHRATLKLRVAQNQLKIFRFDEPARDALLPAGIGAWLAHAGIAPPCQHAGHARDSHAPTRRCTAHIVRKSDI